MAIADNRLSGASLTNLITTDFNKAVTASKSSASAKAAAEAINNAYGGFQGSIGNQANSVKNTAIGVVDNPTNCNGVTKDNVNKNGNLDRKFGTKNTNCDTSKLYDMAISSVSGIAEHITSVNKTVADGVTTITGKESYIFKTIKSVPFSKNLDLSSKVNNKYSKTMSALGGTLKTKLSGAAALTGCSTDFLDSYLPGDNWLLHNLSLSSALDAGGCLSMNKMLGFLGNLESTGKYDKMGIVSGIVSSVGKTGATGMVDKLNLLSSYKSVLTTTAENSEFIQIASTHVKSMVSNIQSDIVNSNSPNSDYNNIVAGIANIDPRWNKDDKGNEDYTLFKDNAVMTKLAAINASSNNTFTGTPSDIVNTPSSVATKIKIVASSKKIETPARNDGSLFDKLIAGTGYGNLRIG